MTDQFRQPNINSAIPRGARIVSTSGTLRQDDDLIAVDSSANPVSVSLYLGVGLPGNIVYIKALTGAINSVTVLAPGGSIDGLSSINLIDNLQSVILKSIGDGNWVRVASFSAGSGGSGLTPATIPGPFSFTSNPQPTPIVNVLAAIGGFGGIEPAGIGVQGAAPGSPWGFSPPDATEIVLDVETSTLEPGSGLIDRTPYGLNGFSYSITNISSGPNPNDANLTRFSFLANGTYGAPGNILIVAMGIVNPSGGASFAGYFVVENDPQS